MRGSTNSPIRVCGGGPEMSLLQRPQPLGRFLHQHQDHPRGARDQLRRRGGRTRRPRRRIRLGQDDRALALMRMIRPPGRIAGGTAHLGDVDLLALKPARDARRAAAARLLRAAGRDERAESRSCVSASRSWTASSITASRCRQAASVLPWSRASWRASACRSASPISFRISSPAG